MSLIDPLLSSRSKLAESSVAYRAVTFDDGAFVPSSAFKGIIVTVAGNVSIEGMDGVVVTLPVAPEGIPLPLGGRSIRESGTTATGIIALF
jgi:hypothetical protein